MSLRRLIVTTALALTLAAAGATAAYANGTPGFYSVVDQFMCVECHEPLNQVNSAEAISEKQYLQGLVSQHLTLPQIRTAMVAQYGEQVLARPPASGVSLAIYIVPPLAVAAGLLLLAVTLPKWRERSRRAAQLPGASPLDPDEARRLDDELTNFI